MARMTVEIPDRLNAVLEDLASEYNISKVDALRRAIALFNIAKRETRATDGPEGGRRLTISDKDNKVIKEILLTE